MNEVEVIRCTHQFLKTRGLWDQRIPRLFTDAHPTLLHETSLKPFQRFILDTGDLIAYPDLVGQLDDGETLIAIEAKGNKDILKGIIQAELYQTGFHFSFLAADAAALSGSLIANAQNKNIGVIAVAEDANVISYPQPQKPYREISRFLARQIGSVLQVTGQQTFQYNVPTHYLVWPILLKQTAVHALDQLGDWSSYPMPKNWRAALAGAQKLGLVRVQGKDISLTHIGSAAKDILPDLQAWADIHRTISARNPPMLAEVHPSSAALLRILLLYDPMVEMVVSGLENFPNHSANFAELAKVCDSLDHARAPIFFLKPEASARMIVQNKGRIPWGNTITEDYRSTMFYQYKRILQHAGILVRNKLGGYSVKVANPHEDIWQLL